MMILRRSTRGIRAFYDARGIDLDTVAKKHVKLISKAWGAKPAELSPFLFNLTTNPANSEQS